MISLFLFFWNLGIPSHYVTFHEIERACKEVVSRGTHRGESRALATIVKYEASKKKVGSTTFYNLHSKNKKTGCYGLWQQHPAHGKVSKTLLGQAKWAYEYAKRRYGCLCRALKFRKKKGYW